jgi:multicomponent Na+:H+ antiporter subunit D
VEVLPPLPVALPLVVAAALAAGTTFLPRRLADAVAIATAAVVTLLCAVLVVTSAGTTVPYWFGGWGPRGDVAIGVAFTVEPMGAGVATVAGALTTAALLFTWRYFDSVGTLFHTLMLVFLAAMTGFALSGDLFNMFVFFELMGAAAYALTGYKIEERGPLQGALNFAVSNTVGGLLVLLGTALVYGRTGALNLAQIGRTLSESGPDGLVVVAFTLIAAGFLVKAAVVPFHFWLADAYAVVPTPVGVVFAGVLSELGLLGVARVLWTSFAGPFGAHQDALRAVLLVAGALTAVVGSIMAFEQRHLKRMLAFVTIAHAGIILMALGLLSPSGLAGAAIYLVADAGIKGALFLTVGVIFARMGSVDEDGLLGMGRLLPYTGAIFVLGGLGLAGLPPFGTALGKAIAEHAASPLHAGWVLVVFLIASAVTGGAVLRAWGRIFLGWGHRERGQTPAEREAAEERPEITLPRGRTPALMVVPAALLLVGALAVGLVPGLGAATETAAHRFQDTEGYAAAVLDGKPMAVPPSPEGVGWDGRGVLVGIATVAAAAGLGYLGLFRRRISTRVRRPVWRLVRPGIRALKRAHSGQVGDYVAWITFGTAVLGGTFAAILR